MAKIKTKKITHTAWCHLDADTRGRILRRVLGVHFRDYMVADSLNKDFIFWEVILRSVRLTTDDRNFKAVINNTSYV